ncbi:MAG TPA: SMC-Scp complex subunit ScpB [Candidatus Moranbacteria bacterium]|nr:SMC-Scp complex subunit ScpB [Candidatus Moranbacteria bacterium]
MDLEFCLKFGFWHLDLAGAKLKIHNFMDITNLKSQIESILFISGDPVKISRIAKVTGAEIPEIENAILVLQGEYAEKGMNILTKEDEVQMATNPENAGIVDQLVKSEIQENLSKAGLEVLAIVAYRGPITRVEIEAVRGVNCSFTLRSLLMRGLVERIDNPKDNRGYLYKISFEFLKKMGVDSVSQLPDFESLSKDERIESILR